MAPDPSVSDGPPPAPGHELYGFLPYWEMDAGIVDHLAGTPLSTIGLFSVTHANDGSLRHGRRRLPRDHRGRRPPDRRAGARARHAGRARLHQLRAGPQPEAVREPGAAGRGDRVARPAGRRARAGRRQRGRRGARPAARRRRTTGSSRGCGRPLVAADPDDQVSVATSANTLGAAMAAAANQAGADRIFMMALRLSDRRVRARRDLAAGPPRRRRQGPAVVARPVRGGGRAAGEAHPRPAAVRRDLAGRRPGDRRAVHRPGRVVDPAQPPRPAAQRAGRPAAGPGRVGRGLRPGLRRQPGAAADGLARCLAAGLALGPGRDHPGPRAPSRRRRPRRQAARRRRPRHARRPRHGRRRAPRRDRRRPRAR